jgi:hypothetical protein
VARSLLVSDHGVLIAAFLRRADCPVVPPWGLRRLTSDYVLVLMTMRANAGGGLV